MQVETSKPVAAIGCKVAIITSSYHQEITSSLARGAEASFLEAGGIAENCMHIQAAGAWELPILAKRVIDSKNADAVIALGCIITGETTHDQVIGHAIAHGLMQVGLECGKPVSMGVLTCQTIAQAQARSSESSSNKGREAMNAALHTIESLQEINT